MKTIIDILRKGNQELFHSSIIAWLLNPKGEHGFNSQFLEGFADILSKTENGTSELKNAISKKTPCVKTETTSYRSRYDIEIEIDDLLFVIENKTKSIGDIPQFDKYKNKTNVRLIALGLCDISYSSNVKEKYPLILYNDILNTLKSIKPDKSNDFSIIVIHYINFLERELSLLSLIVDCYEKGNISNHNKVNNIITEAGSYTTNDYRFLNLYYLETFKAYLSNIPELKGGEWHSEKNQQSGVWLACYSALPKKYDFSDSINCLLQNKNASLWFHIELWAGLTSNNLSDTAGMIQLRCSCNNSKSEFMPEFKKTNILGNNEYCNSRINESERTFYVVGRKIKKEQLIFKKLCEILIDFMNKFGSFQNL